MTPLARLFSTAGLAFAGATATAGAASATVCEDFTLTAAQVAVFENGSWSHDTFQQTGPGQFTIAQQPDWPSQVSLILRWDVDADANPQSLQAVGLAGLPVLLDYQYVGDGFGTSFGAVAQVNNIPMPVGVRPVYFEAGVVVPGCDLIRSAMAMLTVTQPVPTINPDRIPELACQGPGCDIFIRQPGDILINPGEIQQFLPQTGPATPGGRTQAQGGGEQQGGVQLLNPQLLPQIQLRN